MNINQNIIRQNINQNIIRLSDLVTDGPND